MIWFNTFIMVLGYYVFACMIMVGFWCLLVHLCAPKLSPTMSSIIKANKANIQRAIDAENKLKTYSHDN